MAAIREFADHGYAGATTAGIARRAGVTQPLVHHHFGSKKGLWNAVLEDLFLELRTVMGEALRKVEGADRSTRLTHLLRAFVCFSGRRPELSRLIRTESSTGGEGFEDLFESRLSVALSFLLKELSAAVEEGTIRPVDSRFAYFAIIGASTQAFAQPELARRAFGLDVKDEQSIERYADLVVELVTQGLRVTPERKRPVARKGPASRSKQRRHSSSS
ncbi:TetR/AcrR family transcriptional regulator [Archangium violaceum]|uniref:TetR/AcrR family transcriptional regulator n=1 Tax=Archangium violaceum TaxID=83451 RepID=UPI00194E230B|nr:TetR/AcrR family transcriptional regulator [Archangium violaceum]QRN97957.1 TetR/AcrR family transcriptional regulator [Archangium violaceum]